MAQSFSRSQLGQTSTILPFHRRQTFKKFLAYCNGNYLESAKHQNLPFLSKSIINILRNNWYNGDLFSFSELQKLSWIQYFGNSISDHDKLRFLEYSSFKCLIFKSRFSKLWLQYSLGPILKTCFLILIIIVELIFKHIK